MSAEHRHTRRLVYLALFLGTCALMRGEHGLWREANGFAAVTWGLFWAVSGLRDLLLWARPRFSRSGAPEVR